MEFLTEEMSDPQHEFCGYEKLIGRNKEWFKKFTVTDRASVIC